MISWLHSLVLHYLSKFMWSGCTWLAFCRYKWSRIIFKIDYSSIGCTKLGLGMCKVNLVTLSLFQLYLHWTHSPCSVCPGSPNSVFTVLSSLKTNVLFSYTRSSSFCHISLVFLSVIYSFTVHFLLVSFHFCSHFYTLFFLFWVHIVVLLLFIKFLLLSLSSIY